MKHCNIQEKTLKNAIIEKETKDGIIIITLEGNHLCKKGDFIVKGIKGEFYPCKPDIFSETYEEV